MKVKVGTLRFEQGTFEAGSIIAVSEEQYKRFGSDVELVAEEPVVNVPTLGEPQPEVAESDVASQPKPRRALKGV